MFTGIIEATGIVKKISEKGLNKTFEIESPLSPEFRIDQSVSHSGVCLTVEQQSGSTHTVTAVNETLVKSNLNNWQLNEKVNLERSLLMNGRLDGHIVQGHVDATATCTGIQEKDGSWQMSFQFDNRFAALVIEKGSICLNGVSLTIFDVTENSFSVAVIPYTYDHTNLSLLKKGILVNIEFDMIGKYAQRFMQFGAKHAL